MQFDLSNSMDTLRILPSLPGWVIFSMEYYLLGDLYRFPERENKTPCTEEDARNVANQLLYCLDIVYGLAYRDFKSQVRSESQLKHGHRLNQSKPNLIVKHNIFDVQRRPLWWLKLGGFRRDKTGHRQRNCPTDSDRD
jgi:hypothetical protein